MAKPEGYLLGSYRIATAPEPNSSRLTSFKSATRNARDFIECGVEVLNPFAPL